MVLVSARSSWVQPDGDLLSTDFLDMTRGWAGVGEALPGSLLREWKGTGRQTHSRKVRVCYQVKERREQAEVGRE